MSPAATRRVLLLCWVTCMAMITATTVIYFTTGQAFPQIVIPSIVGAFAGALALRGRQS